MRCIGRALLMLVPWLIALDARAVEGTASEVSLKSAFLFKFTNFSEWPAEAMGAPGAPIWLCVIGRDGLADVLEEAVRGRTSRERPVLVRRVEGAGATAGCHVLFIGWTEPSKVDPLLATLVNQPVLTVGDEQGFARRGGMINLIERDGRLRFEINRSAVERAGLQLSSQILKLATLVDEKKDRGE